MMKIKCPKCGERMKMTYKSPNQQKDTGEVSMDVYTCPVCGAQDARPREDAYAKMARLIIKNATVEDEFYDSALSSGLVYQLVKLQPEIKSIFTSMKIDQDNFIKVVDSLGGSELTKEILAPIYGKAIKLIRNYNDESQKRILQTMQDYLKGEVGSPSKVTGDLVTKVVNKIIEINEEGLAQKSKSDLEIDEKEEVPINKAASKKGFKPRLAAIKGKGFGLILSVDSIDIEHFVRDVTAFRKNAISYDELLSRTPPEVKARAVYTKPPKVITNVAGHEAYIFSFKGDPSTSGRRSVGYIEFLVEPDADGYMGAFDERTTNIRIHCSCPFFTYNLEVVLASLGASEVINSNGAWPEEKNPQGLPYLCKHLAALSGYLSTSEAEPKEEVIEEEVVIEEGVKDIPLREEIEGVEEF